MQLQSLSRRYTVRQLMETDVDAMLALCSGNPQSKAFWQKNGFALTGQRTPNENGAYLPMECEL